MEKYGILIGVALLLFDVCEALAIASKAAREVERFREDHHERFNRSEG
jgi:hypothetical protein